jgi:hypothetical protein
VAGARNEPRFRPLSALPDHALKENSDYFVGPLEFRASIPAYPCEGSPVTARGRRKWASNGQP